MLDRFSNLSRFFLLAPLVIADPSRARGDARLLVDRAVWVRPLSPLSFILVLAALER